LDRFHHPDWQEIDEKLWLRRPRAETTKWFHSVPLQQPKRDSTSSNISHS
jgi:hypothetical protein